MSKWKLAPAWANYCAQNSSGEWWWFANEPSFCNGHWNSDGRQQRFDIAAYAMEPRP